jgi:hypothetical protein
MPGLEKIDQSHHMELHLHCDEPQLVSLVQVIKVVGPKVLVKTFDAAAAIILESFGSYDRDRASALTAPRNKVD